MDMVLLHGVYNRKFLPIIAYADLGFWIHRLPIVHVTLTLWVYMMYITAAEDHSTALVLRFQFLASPHGSLPSYLLIKVDNITPWLFDAKLIEKLVFVTITRVW